MQLSIDELRWLHATEAIVDDAPALRARTPSRTSQRHRHYHLLDDTALAPSPRRPTPSLIPAPVKPASPAPTEWIYRSPKRPPRAPAPAPHPPPLCRPPDSPLTPRPPTRSRPRPPTAYRRLSAKDSEKERSIWAMLRPKEPLAIVIAPPRHRASSASSTNSTTSAQSASTPATSPSPSVPASPKPPATATTKSILTRSSSASSRAAAAAAAAATPQRSLAALFTRGTSSSSVTGSVKSVTFVDEPTVHYPDEFDTESDDDDDDRDREHDDLGAGLTRGALAWEMGLDIDTMDLDLSLELDVAPGINLDAPLELDMGQKYVSPRREEFGGILEEDEEGEDTWPDVPTTKKNKADGLKRFLSLGSSSSPPIKTERKLKRRSAPLPTRPTISGPFALGTSPPSTTHAFSLPTTLCHPSPNRSSASLRSQPRSSTSSTSTSSTNTSTSTSTLRARSTSDSLQHPYRTAPPLPARTHTHPRRPRTAPSPATANTSPVSPASSTGLGARCGPYATSLHTAPSLESFRSAAGRSVRSLGSIRSTASARSAIRALLGKIGIGAGEV